MRRFWPVLAIASVVFVACGGSASVDEGTPPAAVRVDDGVNDQSTRDQSTRGSSYVVLIGVDGFRPDYLAFPEARHLADIAQRGARAEGLIPPFPSLTFPGFHTIATGLYPEHHGIVANSFWDPERGERFSRSDRSTVQDGTWYGGEPIWVTAETQGVPAAAFFYPATEADVGGVRPTVWHTYDASVPHERRVDSVLEWLGWPEATRPRLITLYFSAIDSAGHDYGPGADEVVEAVSALDRSIGRLLDGLAPLPYRDQIYIVVVSDHGMATIEHTEQIADTVDLVGIVPLGLGPNVGFYVRGGSRRAERLRDELNDTLIHGRAYLRQELPEQLHARRNPRLGDVVVVAEEGAEIRWSPRTSDPPKGMHGWTPQLPSMHGIFLAMGPGMTPGEQLPAFESVHIYPLLARLLGLTPAPDLDGDPTVLSRLGPVPATQAQ